MQDNNNNNTVMRLFFEDYSSDSCRLSAANLTETSSSLRPCDEFVNWFKERTFVMFEIENMKCVQIRVRQVNRTDLQIL